MRSSVSVRDFEGLARSHWRIWRRSWRRPPAAETAAKRGGVFSGGVFSAACFRPRLLRNVWRVRGGCETWWRVLDCETWWRVLGAFSARSRRQRLRNVVACSRRVAWRLRNVVARSRRLRNVVACSRRRLRNVVARSRRLRNVVACSRRVLGVFSACSRRVLGVFSAAAAPVLASCRWALQGTTGHVRYVERNEKLALAAVTPALSRAEATCAALIPIRKSAAWWDFPSTPSASKSW
jgi:hypothetical protein